MSARRTQVRVEILGDGSGAQRAFKETEQAATQFEAKLAGVKQELLSLGSQATGLNLPGLSGVAGQAGGLLGGLPGLFGGAEGAAGLGLATAATGGLVAGLGALVVVGKESTDELMRLAGETRTLARETGLTAEDASALLAVFKRFGVDGEAASAEMVRFARNLAGVTDASEDAATGGKSASAVMADLGIRVRDSAGNIRPMNDLLLEVADRFQAMPASAQKTADAVALFGRSGAQLLPILNQGSAGIKELEATARQYGLVLTGDNLDAVKAYGLAHKDMTEAFEGLKLQVGVALMPVLVDLAKWGAGFAQSINQTIVPALHDETSAFGVLKSMVDDTTKSLNDANTATQQTGNSIGKTILQWLHDIPNTRGADDPVEQWLREQLARYDASAKEIADHAAGAGKDAASKGADGFNPDTNGQAAKLTGYGSAALEHYLEGMTGGGLDLFARLKTTVEDGLKAASPDGKINLDTERELLPLIAQLADEIDRTGRVSDATWASVSQALGGEAPLVRALVDDYTALAAAKGEAARANQALANASATLKEDQAAAAGEAAAYADQIGQARATQAQHDKEGQAAVRALEDGMKGLRGEAEAAAEAGNAALSGLQDGLRGAQQAAQQSAAAYQAENDQIQRQIDLNNQLVSGLEHERDVKTLAIDEQLAGLRGSRNRDDLRHAAELRRERAQVERDYKPRIDLAREEATVANYGLTQQQKNIQDAAKADAARNAANIQAIQDQITAQQAANKAVADGFTKREASLQAQIDNQNTANQARHDGDQAAIDNLTTLAANSADYWKGRLASDQQAVTDAKAMADYYAAMQKSAEATLAADQARIAALAAAGLLPGAGALPPSGAVGAGGGGRDDRAGAGDASGAPPTQDTGVQFGPPRFPTQDTGQPFGPPRPGLGAGLVAGAETVGRTIHEWHINFYGVGEADLMERLTATIQGIAAT